MSQPGIPVSTVPEEEAVDYVLGLVARTDEISDLVKVPYSALRDAVGEDLLEDITAAKQATGGDLEAVQALRAAFDIDAPAQLSAVNAAGASQVTAVNNAGVTQRNLIAGAVPRNLYASTADALSNGVIGHASLVGGSGGTNGTFDVALSGGGGTGAAARFTVTGGVLVSILWTAKGKNYTSAPTLSFAASAGLTGASAIAVIGQNEPPGAVFGVAPGANSALYDVYENVAGVATMRGSSPSEARLVAVSALSTPVGTFDQAARVRALPEQVDIPVLFNGDGSTLEFYDGLEHVILGGVPRVPSLRQAAVARSGSPLVLTQRLHIPSWGQSNAEGVGYGANINGGPEVISNAAPYATKALMFTNGVRPDSVPTDFNGEEPLKENTQFGGVTGAPSSKGGESCATGMASRFLEDGVLDGNWDLSSAPILFMSNPGITTANVDAFKATGSRFSRLTTHITNGKARATAAGHTYNVPALLWFHGETDAFNDLRSRATYLSDCITVHNDAITTIKAQSGQTNDPLMFFVQVHYMVKKPNNPAAIALAQYDLHNGTTRFCVAPTYPYPFWDAPHPNALGRRMIGELAGRAMKQVIVDHQVWAGLRPRYAWSKGNEFFIKFHVPWGPLALDTEFVPKTQDFGFKIIDGGGTKTITDTRVVASDILKITCSTARSGAANIRYALDYLYGGAVAGSELMASGNLRDSYPTRINIAGQNYFLHNWGVSFDISVNELQPSVV